jgi:glycosyltransferase involved in cell wall biosynthesis
MSPSPVAVLAVYGYCALTRTPFVIDAHSGAFQNPRWRLLQSLQFWLCRQARATIVTNDHLAALVSAHRAQPIVVPDVPVKFAQSAQSGQHRPFAVVCVTSFDRDEPIDAMLQAARQLPDVQFYMTGDARRAAGLLETRPPNVTLTGFLSVSDYGDLIQNAGVVLALTTKNHTMQRGAYEAIYQGTPVIVSDFDILRTAFSDGALHVDNSPEAIVAAILDIRRDPATFRRGALQLKAVKEERWSESKAALLTAIRS